MVRRFSLTALKRLGIGLATGGNIKPLVTIFKVGKTLKVVARCLFQRLTKFATGKSKSDYGLRMLPPGFSVVENISADGVYLREKATRDAFIPYRLS
jgi:hypothetical protein